MMSVVVTIWGMHSKTQTSPSAGWSMTNPHGSEPLTRCTVCCCTNSRCRWSRQSEVSALLFLLHIRRGSVSMARCHGFPWVTLLFLKRQGHGELSFSGRQHSVAHARLHICTRKHISFLGKHRPLSLSLLVHCHLCPSKALIKMLDWNDWLKMEKKKALSGPAATGAAQRWRVQRRLQSLVCRRGRLFKIKKCCSV